MLKVFVISSSDQNMLPMILQNESIPQSILCIRWTIVCLCGTHEKAYLVIDK